ncbi:hypothetical protein RB195_024138 [Necator americanus]|uniref:Uncharacterized protein n=1 Tax=Necator americanus TaxID=51031 RepID=A0ABR1EPA1_NECAM
MGDAGSNKMCSYVCSVSCSMIAEILMIFGYLNNAWIVVNSSSSYEFQRGLNDDCFKSDAISCSSWCTYSNGSLAFPEFFHQILPPGAAMYTALYAARFLLVIQFLWLIFCIFCCCYIRAELFIKHHRSLVMYFCGVGTFSFALLMFVVLITHFTGSILDTHQEDYQVTYFSIPVY